MLHELKITSEFFKAVKSGKKTFEIRLNDRNYKTGDILLLKEYIAENQTYTGDECKVEVTYVFGNSHFSVYGLHKGYVILSIKLVEYNASVTADDIDKIIRRNEIVYKWDNVDKLYTIKQDDLVKLCNIILCKKEKEA